MQEIADKKNLDKVTREWRCNCGRLLFKGEFMLGVIEVKCPRCKLLVYLQEQETFSVGQESFMAVVDPLSGVILSITKGVKTVLGYRAEEVSGRTVEELVSEDFKPAISFWLEKITTFKGTEHEQMISVLELISKEGQVVEVSFLAKVIGLSGRFLVLCVVEKGFEPVKHFKERFIKPGQKKDLDYQYHIWDFVIDTEGIIKFVSPESILGFGEEKVGTSIFDMFADPKAEKEYVLKKMLGGTNTIRDLKTTDASGQELNLKVSFRTKVDHMIGDGLFSVALLKK